MKYVKSILDVIDNYDCIFCDVNGVITDGVFLFYGVKATLETLYDMGKHIIFLSNATRTKNMIKAHLTTLGLHKKFLDKIITSGDVLRHFINSHVGEFKNLESKNKFFVIGNKNFLEGIEGIEVVSSIDSADYVLINGIVSDVKISDSYFYESLLQRQVPFICTNPDKLSLVGDSFVKTPAYTAAKYRRLGGRVYSYGKPFRVIYDRVFEIYPGLKSLRTLCVGDTLLTDIKGASDYGLDSLFITSGIMKKLRKERDTISNFFAEHGVAPTYYTECFT